MHRTTLREIAVRGGVSVMTVSLALRDKPGLPPATRERLRALALEMGYRPDPALTALVAYRHEQIPVRWGGVIALTSDHVNGPAWRNHHTGRFYHEGIQARAAELGYSVEEVVLGALPRMTGARLSKILYARGIDGVIVTPLRRSRGHLSLDWQRFSSLAVGYSCARPNLHRVTSNHYQSMATMIRRLHGYGYQRIGFVLAGWVSERVNHGWAAAYAFAGMFGNPGAMMPWFMPRTEAGWTREHFARWLEAERPEVVVAGSLDVLWWLESLGKRIPDDVGLALLDLADAGGEYAGLFQNSVLVGRAAVDDLVGMMQRNERGVPEIPRVTLIDSTWVPGRTVRRGRMTNDE